MLFTEREVVAEEPITVVYRSDVAAVLQIPEAESCGFSCVLVVHSPVETEVAVVYDTIDGEKHIRYARSLQIRGVMRYRCIPWRDRRASAIFDILKNVIWKKRRYLMRRFLRMK